MAANYLVPKLDYQPEKLFPVLAELVIVMMAVGYKYLEDNVSEMYC